MEDALQTLLTEAGHASWVRFAGLIVLAVCAVFRDLTSGIEGKPAEWISAGVHFAAGVGTSLAAAGESIPWYFAVALGAAASFSSSGLAGKLRGLITKAFKKGGATALLLFFVVGISACSVHQAQIGVRTALVSADEGVAAADMMMAQDAEDASERVLQRIERECGRPCPDAVERYRELMIEWYDAARALRIIHESLVALDEAVEVWISTEHLTEAWGTLCEDAGNALQSFLRALDAAMEDDIPDIMTAAPGALEIACRLAEPYVTGGDDE